MPSLKTNSTTAKSSVKQAINHYYNELDKVHRFSGSRNETSTRTPFVYLVNHYAEKKNLLLVTEIGVTGKKGNAVYPDGVLKNALRFEFGYWEAKDTKDNFDFEINKKLYEDGYPDQNTLFEDTQTAVLYQEGSEVLRVPMQEADRLDEILNQFISYEPTQVKNFNKALIQFTNDVPYIIENLRELIKVEAETNKAFLEKRNLFHQLAQHEINPAITLEDIQEMLIQHILTEDIFDNVFGNSSFHRFNNIALELESVLSTFMDYGIRQNHLQSIKSYYETIRDASSKLGDHHEKQRFLKVIYENFYKVYNPKAADKLGVVYTPNEIVKFIIESTDWLLGKHFGTSLGEKNVEILDPATGTGTFIAELVEHINPHQLEYKYLNEIHANEIAILPYYIANLNIEYTYQQKMNNYQPFKNICFMDTLDNLGFKAGDDSYFEKYAFTPNLYALSSENAERIKRQNEKKISVVIGNPPYNAKQANYNYQNSNRAYEIVDQRIKDTYIKHGTAQNQIVVYDMFTRFYRWAADRLKDKGIIAFITNRTFIDSRAFDGFRKTVCDEFDSIYIVDLRSDVRANPKIAGTTHNVFGIQTGVAIAFFIKDSDKRTDKSKCKIEYIELNDFWRKEVKLEWLRGNPMNTIAFERIEPDAKYNWINQTNNDWDSLMPLIDKDKKNKAKESAFEFSSLGVLTNRDEWVYDFNSKQLEEKAKVLEKVFNESVSKMKMDFSIKWSSSLEAYFKAKLKAQFDYKFILQTSYRPFVRMFHYTEKLFNHRLTSNHYEILGKNLNQNNKIIAFTTIGSPANFSSLASKSLIDGHFTGDSQLISLYTFDSKNQKHDNITDWALDQFQCHYENSKGNKITKEDIFYYVYSILHSPIYRKKYEQNLKREFPRIPFYDDFFQWRDWGKELMDLHINYETQEPFPISRIDADLSPKNKIKQLDFFSALEEMENTPFIVKPRTKLRADKGQGTIEIDTQTTLSGIPSIAWEYKLGNRSALEWILDQYKESKPKDATIAEKFNTYKFEDYKEQVINLLQRVCTISVKTMEIVNQMPQ